MTIRRLDDTKWKRIHAFLKLTPHIYNRNEQKTRKFVEAIYWIMRTGAQWRDLPTEFGKWNSVYNRFADWDDKGIWQNMLEHFVDDPDMEWLLLDSTVVRAHPCAAGAPKKKGGQTVQGLGRSRGGFSTKIHITVDALGNPIRLILTGGQTSDSTQAIPLLEGFEFDGVIADRGYDADKILEFIEENEANTVIPSTKNRIVQRDTDWYTYKDRNLVERFINKIKHYRRIFTRYEKFASRYMAFLSFAATLIWLK
jgi:transposase